MRKSKGNSNKKVIQKVRGIQRENQKGRDRDGQVRHEGRFPAKHLTSRPQPCPI